MQIGALDFKPYIYNTNYLSGSSLGKVSAISEDALTAGTDYSELYTDDLNENPLQRGETSNFADVLQMQFQMSRLNASRLIKPIEETDELLENKVVESRIAESPFTEEKQISSQDVEAQDMFARLFEDSPESQAVQTQFDIPEIPEEMMTDNSAAQSSAMQMDRNLFMMQKAAEAYRVQMFA